MYKMNWGYIFLAVIIYIVIVGCLCSSIRVVPYSSDRAYKSVTENFEELNATNNFVTTLGEAPEPITCRKVHGFKDLHCCPNAKPKQIAAFGIVKGKPRGGNYHWIDNHIVRATKFDGKFTRMIDKMATIQVFDD